ncbi:uncharacterized protein A1O9_01702 [Exophiala aquamarina CBS 119918]|uniref:Alpha/beta hydrolase fold-3 domain-containing protein n=1 Tax=Exophiala aquamarina CBS 119918 TaxID=1182545 RepID=A0A072PUG2_9EURO|nr:uncharacterized protein A1O9_01702 [Exophiala aquamarina CBS 119918]KEF63724.1 hypothetical protein A1O9_01702 [Exophiala aquamarina CBS 119918]
MDLIEDPKNWLALSRLDPELAEILRQGGKPQFDKDNNVANIPTVRAAWAPLYKQLAEEILRQAQPDVVQEEIFIPSRDGHLVRCLAYKPAVQPQQGSPLIVLCHGGGWCFGSPEMDAVNCIKAAQRYHAVALSVDYRLAPEDPFPAAVNDSWDVLKWVAANASQLGANPSLGFIIGGTSAGGNMSAVLSHLARDTALSPPITGIWLGIPALLSHDAVPEKYQPLYLSREQNKDAPILPKAAMDMYEEAYKPDLVSELWNPFNWPSGHANLPPHYFQICGMDVLRDEALLYERVLRKDHGVKTRVDIYPGLPHVYWANFPTHSKSQDYAVDTNNGFGWLLNKVR